MQTPSWAQIHDAIAQAPDLDPDFPVLDTIPPRNMFPARDISELEVVLSQLAYVINGFNIPGSIQQKVESKLKHESEHALATVNAGAVILGYDVGIYNNIKTGRHEFVATHRFDKIPNVLARAAITLYPGNLSTYDVQDAGRLGYDVNRVAKEAKRSNATLGTTIPIPLSYKPTNQVIIL